MHHGARTIPSHAANNTEMHPARTHNTLFLLHKRRHLASGTGSAFTQSRKHKFSKEKTMQKRIIAAALIAATPLFGAKLAMADELPISANISIVSDYAFRGISQTDQRPALQGGFD